VPTRRPVSRASEHRCEKLDRQLTAVPRDAATSALGVSARWAQWYVWIPMGSAGIGADVGSGRLQRRQAAIRNHRHECRPGPLVDMVVRKGVVRVVEMRRAIIVMMMSIDISVPIVVWQFHAGRGTCTTRTWQALPD
jgi:hypothetical protein